MLHHKATILHKVGQCAVTQTWTQGQNTLTKYKDKPTLCPKPTTQKAGGVPMLVWTIYRREKYLALLEIISCPAFLTTANA
jgi:hypothetical protein